MRYTLVCLCALLACVFPASACALSETESRIVAAYEQGELIRLHILADSDAPDAQVLKLQVRDAVVAAFRDCITGDSADAVFGELSENVEGMRQVAEQTARARGFDGSVTAEVGLLTLPEKRYGNVVLPEGEYRGLRITLGSGRGHNWWCILFPSLCLSEVSDEPWQQEQEPAVCFDLPTILRCWLAMAF